MPSFAIDDPIGSWSSEPNLLYTSASHESFAYNNRLYVLGGGGTGDVHHSEVLSSPILSNGSLAGWSIVSNLPQRLIWHSVILNENRIYVVGGVTRAFGPTHSVDSVYTSTINEDGTLTEWLSLTRLPERRSLGKAFIYNNRMYYVGGHTETMGSGPVLKSGVHSAPINPDGSLGTWVDLTSLPEARDGFSTFLMGNRIVLIGGRIGGIVATTTVLTSIINPDGTITPWNGLDPFPKPSHRSGYAMINNLFVMVGGLLTDSVYYASVNLDGTPGEWQKSSNSLPITNCCFPLVAYNGYLYVSGGHDGSNYFAGVYKATLASTPATTLPVPYFNQQDQPWGDDEYNDASMWYPVDPSMARWGCTTTSTAMVLDYYDIDQIPGASPTTPGSLNEWLKSQIDGYLRNGNLNWRAVTRLTRVAHELYGSTILDYRRAGSDQTMLDSDLANNQPDILQIPGHFVVAKGKTGTTYAINDPAYTDRPTLVSYGNSFLSIRRLIPTTTNLSALLLVVDEGVNISAIGGNSASGSAYIENPLTDDIDGGATSGESLQIFELPLPEDNTYSISLSAPTTTPFTLQIYDYDTDAVPTIYTIQGTIDPTNPVTLNYEYSQGGGISFNTIAEHIRNARNLGWIYSKGLANSLLAKLQNAQKAKEMGQTAASQKILFSILTELEAQKGKRISLNAYNLLYTDVNYLLNH